MFDKTLNTIGGPWAENRGRRNASEEIASREDNPFTSGELSNWNRRQGWGSEANVTYGTNKKKSSSRK